MHRTLKAEATRPPRGSFRAQQRCFNAFRHTYNDERPHEALGDETPASHYRPSPRPFPRRLPDLEYPASMRVERLYPNGVLSLGGIQWYVAHCVAGELIGLEEVDEDRWTVHFGLIELGILDGRAATARRQRQFGQLIRADGGVTTARRYRRRR